MNSLRLNLGASDDHRAGFTCIDQAPVPCFECDGPEYSDTSIAKRTVDLREPWPWADSSVEEVYAKDIIEHLPMIHAMNELHRVLIPGGLVEIIVPCWPGIAPFVDPTHTWPIWTSDTKYYFDARWNNPQGERGRLGPAYGISALFRTLPSSRSGVDWTPIAYAVDAPDRRKLYLHLQAVK